MNIVGIIAEYNPFHKGHQFHIEQAVRKTHADYVISIISGPFVQRGGCAIADKYTRAKAALSSGADLVLELPVIYAASSAEFFAKGAVKTLEKLGIVTHLAFGSETDNLASIIQAAQILAEEPQDYRQALKHYLSQGNSFPKARELALEQTFSQDIAFCPLKQPNTILGIEYCKALQQCNSNILPVAIKRIGSNYHDLAQNHLYSSASSIRKQLMDNRPLNAISSQLPKQSFEYLSEVWQNSFPLFDKELSSLVRMALFQVPDSNYTKYLDVTKELSNRIQKHLFEYESFHQFVNLLKTKELTYSRICRCLIHILLGITSQDMLTAKSIDYVPYFRILGMKTSASKLLGTIRQNSELPIITNPADYLNKLNPSAKRLLELDCYATHLWNGIAGEKFHHAIDCEYRRKFMKI